VLINSGRNGHALSASRISCRRNVGRRLGVPNDPDFQNRVIVEALMLLEAPDGPVLEDFPEDAPLSEVNQGPVACPVDSSMP